MTRFAASVVLLLVISLNAMAADPVPEWIWSRTEPGDNDVVYFRTTFDLPVRKPADIGKDAIMFATCDNEMAVFVNGKRVAVSEAWEQPTRTNVSAELRPGRNMIAVLGRNHGGAAGLLVRLTVPMAGDKRAVIVTDGYWVFDTALAEGWEKPEFDDRGWHKVHSLGKLGMQPWGDVFAGQPVNGTATSAESLTLLPGFKAELLYSVPKHEQGSWVNMCFDDKGRIIVSDQNGILYRLTVDKPEKGHVQVEPIEVRTRKGARPIGKAHGLCHAFGSLYVMIADGGGEGNGLYRLRDTDGDDKYDTAELLKKIDGGGEHGPHAIRLSPDGKSLYVVAGNHTKLPKIDTSRVVQKWGEDNLLPRMWDAGGHAVGIMAPGGWICKIDPDAKHWELVCVGFRNQFDIDFNQDGELFTYDSDMEWDIGLPWYRPTRVNHCVSGAEFGWRSGSINWPDYYADSLPATVNIGPGSPTGITFGTGARFPTKYQQAMYALDWTYGIIYAIHLYPNGSSYIGQPEKFLAGKPLPVTDAAIGPDGALYFTIGGRGTQSGLYRVSYVGTASTEPPMLVPDPIAAKARAIRHNLESFHGKQDPKAIETAWPYLGHADRFLRFAARTAIEHQPLAQWQEKALAERDPQAQLTILIALARCGDKSLQPALLRALNALDWTQLTEMQRLELVRAYTLAVVRMGKPDPTTATEIIARLNPHFPSGSFELNWDLSALLLFLDAADAVAKTMALLWRTDAARDQIGYAYNLRPIKTGWTPELRRKYFEWYTIAANYKGGHSFAGFIRNMKAEAIATLTSEEKKELAGVLNAKPVGLKRVEPPKPRPFVNEWSVSELVPLVEKGSRKRDFNRGRAMYVAAQCAQCHRFDGDGGSTGPDLTGVAGRFNVRDLLESIVEPSKVISDQYQSTVLHLRNGNDLVGRIVAEQGSKVSIMTDLLKPEQITTVDAKQIESREASKVSSMPEKLLSTLSKDEVLDLVSYLLSGGDRGHAAFR